MLHAVLSCYQPLTEGKNILATFYGKEKHFPIAKDVFYDLIVWPISIFRIWQKTIYQPAKVFSLAPSRCCFIQMLTSKWGWKLNFFPFSLSKNVNDFHWACNWVCDLSVVSTIVAFCYVIKLLPSNLIVIFNKICPTISCNFKTTLWHMLGFGRLRWCRLL